LSNVKKLISHTAIYGLSSIIGRTLNWFLVPLYTRVLPESEYGISNTIYAYAGFMLIFMSIGMETTFFRFSKDKTYTNNIFALLYANVILIAGLLIIFSNKISLLLNLENVSLAFILTVLTLAFDTLCLLPFAKLRIDDKPFHFVSIKLINIAINIGLNLYFYWFLKQDNVVYMFVANAVASIFTYILLMPQTFQFKIEWNIAKQKEILKYSVPLVIVGLAGIINEMIDRPMLQKLLPYTNSENLALIGIYSASYKLSMIMTMFRQAYVLSAEPLFFKKSTTSDAKPYYAKTLEFFVAASCIIFLITTLMLPYIQFFIGSNYRSGISIVPVLLFANLTLGIYYHISVWYKMSDKTNWGALISIFGAVITIILNYFLIPKFGYKGAAYATFICYISMVCISFYIGQKKYFIAYNIPKIGIIIGSTMLLYILNYLIFEPLYNSIFIKFILIFIQIFIFYLIFKNAFFKKNFNEKNN
jgi:O-antigen/teichoic acid export membrane protein